MENKSKQSYLIFGASRGLGYQFASEISRYGHSGVAMVRQDNDAGQLHKLGFQCAIGDALNPQDVKDVLAGVPVDCTVISTIGSYRSENPVDFEGNRVIIDAMERRGLGKLLLVTSWGCGDTWQWLSPRFREIIGGAVRLKSLAETWVMSSSLDYRILRPVGLIDGEATGAALLTQSTEVHGLVRRADVARLGLQLVGDSSAKAGIFACHDPTLEKSQ